MKKKQKTITRVQKSKWFELEAYAFYPVKIRIKAADKKAAIKLLENKDTWDVAEQEHLIKDWTFDTWYHENIKEVKGRIRRNKKAYSKEQLHNVFKDKEGLS